jgi:predicted transcriptional regulator
MVDLIEGTEQYLKISGPNLKAQRQAAGLSLRNLADLIKAATGEKYIVINGYPWQLCKQTIWRMQKMHTIELEPAVALIIQRIFK